jgi:ribosomal protein L37AE/L43A
VTSLILLIDSIITMLKRRLKYWLRRPFCRHGASTLTDGIWQCSHCKATWRAK